MSATGAFKGNKRAARLLLLLILILLLELRLQLFNSFAIEGAVGDAAVLQGTSVEPRAVVVVAMPNDLAAAHNNGAMAIVERRLGGLLHAQVQVVVGLHFGYWVWLEVVGDCWRILVVGGAIVLF